MLPFEKFEGSVSDTKGRPIDNIKIVITLFRTPETTVSNGNTDDPVDKEQPTRHRWKYESKTGHKKFSIPVDSIPETLADGERYLQLTVTSNGFLPHNQWLQPASFKGKFGRVKLRRAVKLIGQLAMPKKLAGTKIQMGTIKFFESTKTTFFSRSTDYSKLFNRTIKTKADGSFEVIAPEASTLQLTAFAQNAASVTKKIKIKPSDDFGESQDLGTVTLAEGAAVSGVVFNLEGDPVEGQIVLIRQATKNVGYFSNQIDGYAMSDANGRFTLPPREGTVKISLSSTGMIDGRRAHSTPVLPSKSQRLKLTSGKEPKFVEINEQRTWKVSGTIEPPPELALSGISAWVSGNGSDDYQKINLNAEGTFEIKAVEDAKITLWISGQKNGEFYDAKLTDDSYDRNREDLDNLDRASGTMNQQFRLHPVRGDVGSLDFVLSKYEYKQKTPVESFFDIFDGGE